MANFEQQWEPVVFKKPQKKTDRPSTAPHSQITKVEKSALDSTEGDRHETVSAYVRKQIVSARTAKKISQADLAKAMCVQVQVVQQYENGKAIPKGDMLAKMSKALGVKIKK
jgi:putative transcription factor